MKKTLFILVVASGTVLLLNQHSFAWRHTLAAKLRATRMPTSKPLSSMETAHRQPQQDAAPPPTTDKQTVAVTAAPAFALKDAKGKTVRLADFKGKVVLINFWATWCAPCQKEMPELVKLQKKYAAQGLQILGVTYEAEKPAVLNRLAQKFKINYPFLLGTEELAQQYHVEDALPTTIIVDRNGNIQTLILGMIDSKDVEEKLARFLR
ncbi:MAG: TlpA family protein disulfide reductase [Acidobacteria bacterium]|nr:TlpA family protein disulfide reductase [Acidobacteriota bacterium]